MRKRSVEFPHVSRESLYFSNQNERLLAVRVQPQLVVMVYIVEYIKYRVHNWRENVPQINKNLTQSRLRKFSKTITE
jgi:hypothetical protein